MKSSEYEYREIDPEDYSNEIINLFSIVFHKNITFDQYKWKYLDVRPERMRVWGAFDSATGNLIGSYAVFKEIFNTSDGAGLIVYQGSDGMVLREHRRFGVFNRLMQDVAENLSQEGVDLWINYCNQKSLPGILKATPKAIQMNNGFVRFYPVGLRNVINKLPIGKRVAGVLDLLCSPFLHLSRILKVKLNTTDLQVKHESGFGFMNSLNYNELIKHHTIFPDRSEEYLRWKTVEAPEAVREKVNILSFHNKLKCIGYCVYSMDGERNVLVIRSLLCSDKSMFQKVLIEMLRIALHARVDGILTNCTSDLYHSEYERFGFVKGNMVLCAVWSLDNEYSKLINKSNFWLQEPIDRDLYDY